MNTVEAILEDLDVLIDGAMWAHAHGYWKAGHGLDHEHGVDLSKSDEQKLANANTYDLDVGGDQRCRDAYQHTVRAITHADADIAAMLLSDGVRFQPQVERLDDYAFPTHLRRASRRLRWRLSRVDAERHKPRLKTIRSDFDKAIRGLSKALEVGSTVVYTAHKDTVCRTCEIRPRPNKKAECNTCASWRHRHNGTSRPTRLDSDSINQARAAKVRRMERDEGWGVA